MRLNCFIYLLPCLVAGQAAANTANGNDSVDLFSLSLKELSQLRVETVSKSEQSIQDAPGIISVISREEIHTFGANNLLEVLQRFPGFVPVSDSTFGPRGAALRGDTNISGERILTLVDGRPYRSQTTAVYSTRALYAAFPLEAVERIELIRGPGSVLYGTNAVTGVINIITRKSDSSEVTATVKSGRYNSQQHSVYGGYTKDELHLHIAVDHFETDGWRAQLSSGVTDFDYRYFQESLSIHSELSYGGFSFRSLLIDYETNEPTIPESIENRPIEAKHRFFDIGYKHRFDNAWGVEVYLSQLTVSDSPFDIDEDNLLLEISVDKQLTEQLSVLLGGTVNEMDIDSSSQAIRNYKQRRYSQYSQLSFQWNPAVNVFIGAQWNKEESGESQWVPRAGLIYKLEQGQGIKLLYSEAFRAPTAAETDFQLLPFFTGDPALESETVETVDLQWFTYQQSYQFTATAFHSQYNNLIENKELVFGPGGVIEPGTFVQQNERDTYGLELDYEHHITDRDNLKMSYTWQRNDGRDSASNDSQAPRWTYTLGYSHQFNQSVVVAVHHQHVDAFGAGDNALINPKPESYDLLSANIRFSLKPWLQTQVIKNAEFAVYAYNVLDEDIDQPELISSTPNTIPVNGGRGIYGSLQFSW